MYNFTKVGFKKVRAPAALMELINEFWENNRDKQEVEWRWLTPYHNTWDSPTTFIGVENTNLIGGGYELRAKILNAVRNVIEEWTGMKQAISSVYGIRVYHNGSILTPHADRLPLVSSAILNVAQDLDEDWPLEVYDHDGIAYNVTMQPGDLVLYESHSIIHGRPFPLKGNYFANIFLHFEPIGPLDASQNTNIRHNDILYPPYLVPGSYWESYWLDENPSGWNLLEDARRLVRDGDLYTIQYAVEIHPTLLQGNNDWKPIHEAVQYGHWDLVNYLINEEKVDLTSTCREYFGQTPLEVAYKYLGSHHPITELLQRLDDERGKNEQKFRSRDPKAAELGSYHSSDDASWATWNTDVQNDILGSNRAGIYKDFIKKCRAAAIQQNVDADVICQIEEKSRLDMNKYQPGSVRKMPFERVRNA